MYVEYNDVPLHVIELNTYEREAVYTEDNADLLYIRHVLGVTCTYAPGGVPALVSVTALSPETAGMLNRANAAAPYAANARGFDPGVVRPRLEPMGGLRRDQTAFLRSGAETDAELRHLLLTPRKKLILWAYDRQTGQKIAWLESPRPGFSVDADNGPRPIACDVVAASGEPSSVAVHFMIETAQAPCPVGSDRFVLAHRWQVSHGHDEDYYLTRTIEGTITFHPGVRDIINIHPDRIRNQFIHPVPLGFRRGLPEIVQSSDGLTIRYVITDTDPTVVFAPGDSGATQIDIQEKFQYVTPALDPRSWLESIGDGAKRIIGLD